MLGNKEIMSDTIWSEDKRIAVGYAEMYDQCVDPERKSAIVISIIIDLHGDEYEILDVEKGRLINDSEMPKPKDSDKDKGVPNYEMG